MAARTLWKARTRARRRQLFVVGAHSRPSPVQLTHISSQCFLLGASASLIAGREISKLQPPGQGTMSNAFPSIIRFPMRIPDELVVLYVSALLSKHHAVRRGNWL